MAQSVQENNSPCATTIFPPTDERFYFILIFVGFSAAFSISPLPKTHRDFFLYSLVSFLSTLLFCCAFVYVYDCVWWFPCTKTFPAEVYKSLFWQSALTFINSMQLHIHRDDTMYFWVQISMFCK